MQLDWHSPAQSSATTVVVAKQKARSDRRTLTAVLVGSVLLVVTLRGWLSDDAFVSLRVADNLVNGYGLTFNPGYRVQAFTNPLWVLMLSAVRSVVASPYVAAMGLCLVCTTVMAVWVFAWLACSPLVGLLAAGLFCFSQSFVDFSTSGLENPLSHALYAALVIQWLRPSREPIGVAMLWGLGCLMAFNRLDGIVVALPVLFCLHLQQGVNSTVRSLRIAAIPLVAWLLFATAYFGSPIPNTALAKLNVSIPRAEMVGQGLVYLLSTAQRDLVTAATLLGGVLIGLFGGSPGRRAVAAGVVLHVAYIVMVAGDFMLGRFLSVPFVGAVLVIADFVREKVTREQQMPVLAAVALLAMLSPHNPFRETAPNSEVPASGIADERAWYVQSTGLGHNLRRFGYLDHTWYRAGAAMATRQVGADTHCNAGLAGYAAGPDVHLVDEAGLADGLLARIEYKYRRDWRTAHYGREIPAGYLETLRSGRNQIVDPGLREFYDKVERVETGPITSLSRMKTAWHLNMGHYDHLLTGVNGLSGH